MNIAREVAAATQTKLVAAPVVFDGVAQQTLRELTAPLDVQINGITLRLPAGEVIAVLSGGAGGIGGKLFRDVEFAALNGRTYRASAGTALLIPAR